MPASAPPCSPRRPSASKEARPGRSERGRRTQTTDTEHMFASAAGPRKGDGRAREDLRAALPPPSARVVRGERERTRARPPHHPHGGAGGGRGGLAAEDRARLLAGGAPADAAKQATAVAQLEVEACARGGPQSHRQLPVERSH